MGGQDHGGGHLVDLANVVPAAAVLAGTGHAVVALAAAAAALLILLAILVVVVISSQDDDLGPGVGLQ